MKTTTQQTYSIVRKVAKMLHEMPKKERGVAEVPTPWIPKNRQIDPERIRGTIVQTRLQLDDEDLAGFAFMLERAFNEPQIRMFVNDIEIIRRTSGPFPRSK